MIITDSRKGEPTATLNGLFLHSKYDPVREAKKLAAGLNKADLYVIGGFGLGYETEEIAKLHTDSIIAVFEPSVEFFLKAKETRDLSFILSNKNIYFIIDQSAESIKDFFIPGKIKKIEYIPNNNRIKGFEEKFDPLKESIRLYLSRLEINRNTLLKFGKLWVKNQSRNLPYMGYDDDISILFNKFNDIPGIIVSAGPSMEIIIPYLKEIKDKFLILTVDTAVKSLLDEGIEPDFIMSIDSQYWNAKHLEGVETDRSILIADSSIQPSALRNFDNRVYFTASTFPIGKYFESVRPAFPKIASGGSVSTNIWDFALKLGLKEIFFIGQDLGFPGYITHYKNSFFENNMLITSNRLNTLESQSFNYIYSGYPTIVESNSGKEIISDKRMTIYIEWFKEKLKLNSIKNCYNLSPDGCHIPGMPFKELEEILKYESSRMKIDLILKDFKHNNNCFYHKDILEAALKFREQLERIVSLGVTAERLSNRIEIKYNNRENINQDLKTLSEIDNKIVGFNQSQTLSFIIEPFIAEITDSEPGTALEGLKLSAKLYKKIIKTGNLHIKYLNQSIETIKNLTT